MSNYYVTSEGEFLYYFGTKLPGDSVYLIPKEDAFEIFALIAAYDEGGETDGGIPYPDEVIPLAKDHKFIPAEDKEEDTGNHTVLYVSIAALTAIVVISAITAVVVIKRRKRKAADAPIENDEITDSEQ